jgi:DNA-directed RNA polymerase beta' subunit
MQTRLSDKERKRLGFINRQPSLSRHSAPVVLIEPTDDSEDETIHVSPSFLEPLNADLDGDTVALYIIHDREALLECEDKAFLQNSITYDQNNSFLATIRHEALYAAFVLTKEKFNKDNIIVKNLNSLKDLPESPKLWNDHLYDTVQMKSGELHSYGRCLFNKFCGFDKVIITKSLSKKLIDYVSEEIYTYFNKDNKKYYDSLAALEKRLFFFISSTSHAPSLDVEDMVNLKNDQTNKIFKNLPNNNIKLGYYIVEALTNRALDSMDENSSLYKLYKSGSRFSKAQLARSAVAIGYSADADNVVIPRPIKTSLLEGLSEEQYFMVAPATRKSIKDKSRHTPNSGYLERTLVMALSMIEFDLDDCETNNHLEFIVMSNKHAQTLVGKYHRDPNSTDREWKVLDLKTAIGFINRKIEVRSPMTCQNKG